MRKFEFHSQSGNSLIEALIVVAIGGIVVALAVMRVTNAQANLDRQNIAREFKVSLERARFDAVKRRAIDAPELTRITLVSATVYKILIDANQNGILHDDEERTVNFGNRSKVRILGPDFEYPITITFDRFGNTKIVKPGDVPVAPVFTFCEGECTLGTANLRNSNVISLSPTGTVAMLNGGETLPTFNAPTVTDVGTGASVNEWVVVRDDNAAGPLRTPTPNPPANPNPTPTPNPTETPSETPTPTPTPVYCASGQKPSQSQCVCQLPMTVRTNGKCQ